MYRDAESDKDEIAEAARYRCQSEALALRDRLRDPNAECRSTRANDTQRKDT